MTKDQIRAVFLAHGFTVKDGQTDLKPYVYDAAEALLRGFIHSEVAHQLNQIESDLDTSHNTDGMYAADVHGDRDAVICLESARAAVDAARVRLGIAQEAAATAAQQQPLTPAQIKAALSDLGGLQMPLNKLMEAIVRATERAHGIGPQGASHG